MFKEIFDHIEHESYNRELHALTGTYHGHRLTALSTGMGCDNIDIVLTELDAAATILAPTPRHLRIVRIGTSGSLQPDVDCGCHVATRFAVGLDGLMNYYAEWHSPVPEMEKQFLNHLFDHAEYTPYARPYCIVGSESLLSTVGGDMHHGITATAPGFYGPQGRAVHVTPAIAGLNDRLASFSWQGTPLINLEMETSAIYGFAHMMAHEALTVCLIIANRPRGTFLNDYHQPMRQLVGTVVERLCT